MVTPNTFYKSYQLHHHRAKAGIFKAMLDNELLKAENLVDTRWAFNDEDLGRTLRIARCGKMFYAIETFFTIYFCLPPVEHGTVDDLSLYYNLSKRLFYYENIRNIAEGRDDLSVLEKEVQFGNSTVLFRQYLLTLKKHFLYSDASGKGDPTESIEKAVEVMAEINNY
jgi:DnaJ-domain-containing protein 1